jgi:hypothetical protein
MTYILGVLTPAEQKQLRADGWRLLEPEHIDLKELWALFTDASVVDVAAHVPCAPGYDFGERVADLFAHGLEDAEILGYLDPDTAGTDLIALVRRLMSTATCRFCHKDTDTATAHRHEDDWVCDECWDERLRTTS